MKFIRKNGRVIPIRDKKDPNEGAYSKAYRKGLVDDDDAYKKTKYRKMSGSEVAKQSFALAGISGTIGGVYGAIVGAIPKGRSLKRSAVTGAVLGGTFAAIGGLRGAIDNKEIDVKKTDIALNKMAAKRLENFKKRKKK